MKILQLVLLSVLLAPLSVPARDFDAIRESGELRVLFLSFENSPYFGVDPATGERSGLDHELLQRFARRHRLELVVQSAPDLQNILARVASGEVDVAAGGITAIDEREDAVDFTVRVTPQRHVVSTWRRRPVESAAELRELRVLTAADSSWEGALEELGHPRDRRVYPETFSPMAYVDALREDRADAAATGLVFALLMRREDSGIGLGLLLGEPGHHAWATPPGSEALQTALDKLLVDVQTSEEWTDLVTEHFGPGAVDLFRRAQR